MKRVFYGAMIALMATAFLTSCEEVAKKPAEPVALDAPTLTVAEQTETSFMVIWDLVENAVSYTYTIDNGAEQSTTNESAEFTDLTAGTTYTVKVKAVAAEDSEYLDSQWATLSVTTLEGEDPVVEPQKLDTPELSIEQQGENLVISWTAVENAASYKYVLDQEAPATTEELSVTFAMADLAVGEHSVSVTALPEEGSEEFLESDPATGNFTISGDTPDADFSEWLGTYTMTSTHTLEFGVDDQNYLTMNYYDEPITAEVSIVESEDPDYVYVYGISQLFDSEGNGFPLLASLFYDNYDPNKTYLGILTDVKLGEDSEGTDMMSMPICDAGAQGLNFVSGCQYAFVIDPETMTTEPYTSQLEGGASFTVVAVDVFGLSGNSVSIYHEIPSYLPAGTFSFEKTSSSSSAAFSRSFKGFDKIRGSAFGLLPYSIAQSCR